MARKAKSRGRNLRRTETQAALDTARYVSGERGRSPGMERIAISASAPRLPRKFPRTRKTLAVVAPNGELAHMVTYYVDPASLR